MLVVGELHLGADVFVALGTDAPTQTAGFWPIYISKRHQTWPKDPFEGKRCSVETLSKKAISKLDSVVQELPFPLDESPAVTVSSSACTWVHRASHQDLVQLGSVQTKQGK
jgi:hypothetical protein